jgi:hypothetical protein
VKRGATSIGWEGMRRKTPVKNGGEIKKRGFTPSSK